MKFPTSHIRQLTSWLPVIVVAIGLGVAGLLLFGPRDDGKDAAAANPPASLATNCPAPNKLKCYKAYFAAKTDDTSAKDALAELQKIFEYDTYAQSHCHQLAHAVGHAAYRKYGSLPA